MDCTQTPTIASSPTTPQPLQCSLRGAMGHLVLDPLIRDWVLIPLTVVIVAAFMLRTQVLALLESSNSVSVAEFGQRYVGAPRCSTTFVSTWNLALQSCAFYPLFFRAVTWWLARRGCGRTGASSTRRRSQAARCALRRSTPVHSPPRRR